MKLAVKLPFQSESEFLGRYGGNVSRGGLYLRTKALHPPGTHVALDVKIESGQVLIHATCEVKWVTGAKPGVGAPGMGLKFLVVDAVTQRLLDTMAAAMPHARAMEIPLPKGVGEADASPDAVPKLPPPAPRPSAPPPSQALPTLPSMAKGTLHVGGDPAQLVAPEFEAPREPPAQVGPIIGIDLGTTYSCAAYARDGKPQVLPSREGHRTVPSIIALSSRGKLLVGHPAKSQLLTNPKLTVYGAKRLIGRAFDSETVQKIRERFSYEICAGPGGEAAVRLADKVFSLQQVSALILRELKESAEAKLGEPVSRAVITVPAYYNDNQRQAVRQAGQLAGLHVERIVNEPTAAALAYGYGKHLTRRVLVYDLGGGTFDASILEVNDSVYEVVSTGGDTFLGGIDFDDAIVKWLIAGFEKEHGKKFQTDRVGLQRIFEAAERAKISLSDQLSARIHVPFVTMIENKPYDIDATLSREQLTELVRPLVERTIAVCADVLNARKMKRTDLAEVILVGGQSRAAVVRDYVEAFFGRPPAKSVHPDEAVATGAALLAYALAQKEGLVLIDVLPMSIGVGLPGGRFKPVIERNTALPATKTYTLATTRDDQRELEVVVFQGEDALAAGDEYLGTLTLTDLPRGPKGAVKITLGFEVSNEGLLKLKAREETTGNEVAATFGTRGTPAEVRARLEHEAALAEASMPPPRRGLFGWLRGLFG
ncbi:MAG: TIGR02266 family protein [Archangiaceae bacterium]|nr:TIGR02266 family protein [Archangiaceae bacterium]